MEVQEEFVVEWDSLLQFPPHDLPLFDLPTNVADLNVFAQPGMEVFHSMYLDAIPDGTEKARDNVTDLWNDVFTCSAGLGLSLDMSGNGVVGSGGGAASVEEAVVPTASDVAVERVPSVRAERDEEWLETTSAVPFQDLLQTEMVLSQILGGNSNPQQPVTSQPQTPVKSRKNSSSRPDFIMAHYNPRATGSTPIRGTHTRSHSNGRPEFHSPSKERGHPYASPKKPVPCITPYRVLPSDYREKFQRSRNVVQAFKLQKLQNVTQEKKAGRPKWTESLSRKREISQEMSTQEVLSCEKVEVGGGVDVALDRALQELQTFMLSTDDMVSAGLSSQSGLSCTQAGGRENACWLDSRPWTDFTIDPFLADDVFLDTMGLLAQSQTSACLQNMSGGSSQNGLLGPCALADTFFQL